MKKNISIYLILLCVFGLQLPCSARVSIEPSKYEGAVPPGGVYSNDYSISNPNNYPLTIVIQWNDRTIGSLSETWLKFERTEVTVQPQSTQTASFTITIPENAEGLYYARVRFMEKIDPNVPNALGINYNFPIRIRVDGTEQYDYNIEKVELFNDGAFRCNVYLFNDSNVHLYPKGTIDIIDAKGTHYNAECKLPQGVILPQQLQVCKTTVTEESLPDGEYTVSVSFVAGDDKTVTCEKTVQFVIQDGNVQLHKSVPQPE